MCFITLPFCWDRNRYPFSAVMQALNVRCQTREQPVDALFQVILDRKDAADETAYTAYLFREGLDKILKKVGEACSLLLMPQRAATGEDCRRDGQPDLSSDGHDGL